MLLQASVTITIAPSHLPFLHNILFMHFPPCLPTTGRTFELCKIFASWGLRPITGNNIYCPATPPHELSSNPSHIRSHRLGLVEQHLRIQGQTGPGLGLVLLLPSNTQPEPSQIQIRTGSMPPGICLHSNNNFSSKPLGPGFMFG